MNYNKTYWSNESMAICFEKLLSKKFEENYNNYYNVFGFDTSTSEIKKLPTERTCVDTNVKRRLDELKFHTTTKQHFDKLKLIFKMQEHLR